MRMAGIEQTRVEEVGADASGLELEFAELERTHLEREVDELSLVGKHGRDEVYCRCVRIITLNVNGIRSAASKGLFEWLKRQRADVVCLQETKAQEPQLARRRIFARGAITASTIDAERKGYSGHGALTRDASRTIWCAVSAFAEFDREGRYLEARFGKLSVVSVYLPSGSAGPERQASKFRFLDCFRRISRNWRAIARQYILCGDWNIAHKEIDLKNWRSNRKNSGFLPEERAWLDELFGPMRLCGCFPPVNEKPHQYTWWSNRGRAWEKNVGWRIDYQVVSNTLREAPAARQHLQDAPLLRSRTADHGLRPLTEARATSRSGPRGWLDALLVYRQPRVAAMLFLGFSAGLPFMLVFQTLSAWLRQAGIERATIGMLAWVGILYSIKFLWAPVVDRVPLPLLHRLLGRRRSWMLLAQIGVIARFVEPRACRSREPTSLPSCLVRSSSRSRRRLRTSALDAWRIESAPADLQGAMAAATSWAIALRLRWGPRVPSGSQRMHGWPMTYT